MNQRDVIIHNKEVLEALDSKAYPNLDWFLRKKKLLVRLEAIMDHMLSYLTPVWPSGNKRYYAFSMPYLKKWAKEKLNIAGSEMTWQGQVVFFEDAGLINRIRVTGPSQDPFLNSVWEQAIERTKNRNIPIKTESLWTTKQYNPKLLSDAEEVAKIYRDADINLYHFTKSDMIRLRGKERSDRFYIEKRNIMWEEDLVYDCMIRAINEIVDKKGYARPAEVEEKVARMLDEQLHFTHPDRLRMDEWTADDLKEHEREKTFRKEIKKAMARKKTICHDCGCVYRQATLDMRAKYGIEVPGWIIIRAEN